MTKEEYRRSVVDAASTLLTESEAREWKEENPDQDFFAFAQATDLSDCLHSVIDATTPADWKTATEVLQLTEQDPNNVDPGLYAGCDWQQILVVIAFEVYAGDVWEKAREMFENDDFEEFMVEIPTHQRQIGHFPDLQGYKIPKGPWVVEMHNAIKILVVHRSDKPPDLSVVFEGSVEERKNSYVVYAKRVYTQGGSDANIQGDLKRCKEEFGVRLYPSDGSSP